MNLDKILVMIKPWALNYSEEILAELDQIGNRTKTIKIQSIPLEVMAKQYKSYSEIPILFQDTINDLAGKPAILAIYEGKNSIFNRKKQEIRLKYDQFMEKAPYGKVTLRNSIHTTLDNEEFENDYNAWKDYF